MKFGAIELPKITNEPLKHYPKGSQERKDLLEACKQFSSKTHKIPCIINGKEIFSNETQDIYQPGDNKKKLFTVHGATKDMIKEAIEGSLKARQKWSEMPIEDRLTIFLKAAELLSTKYRNILNATTMLGQSKTMWQAEIDSACETIDFLKCNCEYAQKLYNNQPMFNSPKVWNKVEYRPLEGFVCAISPFNFTAIGVNLCTMPAMLGNVVIWKPSRTACLSNYYAYQLLKEAGLPDGVIQFIPCVNTKNFSDIVFEHPDLSGLHFTGSTPTFQYFWNLIGKNISKYKTYPRIVGETGGKNFHVLHKSGEIESFVNNTIRGAFEFSGQKCSATSRCYIPKSLWPKIKNMLIEKCKKIKTGKPDDPNSFLSSVIDEKAYKKIVGFIERAKKNKDCELVVDGGYSDKQGWYIEPHIILSKDPHSETMETEIFGPVLTIYLYEDDKFEETLDLVDKTSIYSLTGSIFAVDRYAVNVARNKLRNSSGNFYINDKSTGAVVGQQCFGGARASGTNDKAGSEYCLLRWLSMRAIKENLLPLKSFSYPSVDDDQ